MRGFRVRPLVRPGRHAVDSIEWDPAHDKIDAEALEGLEAIVHLAGENIADGRWNTTKKARIKDSRVRSTSLLASTIARLTHKPKVWVSGSASGYYGNAPGEVDENSPAGGDFLAEVVRAWEAAAQPVRAHGVRVVHPRLGVVLAPEGGALARMLPAFKLGAGGPLGDGTQGMSWIALIDTVRAIVHMIEDESLEGPVNVTAPGPVTNAEFTRALGDALERPTLLRVPATFLRLAFGEMADAALLGGVRALPKKLLASGFRFEQPTLARYLAQALG